MNQILFFLVDLEVRHVLVLMQKVINHNYLVLESINNV